MVKVKRVAEPHPPPYFDLDGYYLSLASAGTAKEYEEDTFTPTVMFGGGSTGITYTTQTGTYTKIGRLVFFSLRVTLSAKGSSTGAADIGSLPFTVASNASVAVGFYGGMTGLTGVLVALASASSTNIRIRQTSATSTTTVTDTSFTNTSDLIISGSYETT